MAYPLRDGEIHLLESLTECVASGSLGVEALEALRVAIGASAVWVHVLEPAGSLRLAGQRGLPADIASQLVQLPPSAPELAARAIRSGEPEDLTSTDLNHGSPSDTSILRQLGTSILCAIPLRVQDTTLGVLSYTPPPGAEVPADHVRVVAALLSFVVAGFNAVAATRLLETVHAREQAFAAATNAINRLNQIIQAAPEGMLFVDSSAGAVMANRRFVEIIGRPVVPENGIAQEVGIVEWPDAAR